MSAHKSEQKNYRIDMRLTAEQRAQIDRAADLKGMSLTQWAVSHLLDAAHRDIQDETTTVLSAKAFDAFEAALGGEPQYSEAAKKFLEIKPQWADEEEPQDADENLIRAFRKRP